MIRVVVADDQQLVAAGFSTLIDHEPDLEIAAVAHTGVDAVEAVRAHRPDIALMDIRMPEMDGIEATRRIVADRTLADTRVMVLTTFSLDEYVVGALRAGASAFLLKDTAPVDLLTAIRTVHAGDALLSPAITRRLIEDHVVGSTAATTPDLLQPLTDREREVVAEVARGQRNDEIADVLHMSPLTAKTHVSRALQKLGLRDRAQLVIAAYESGLVVPGADT